MSGRGLIAHLVTGLWLAACGSFGEAGAPTDVAKGDGGGPVPDGAAAGSDAATAAPEACTSLCPVGYWAFAEKAGEPRLVDGSGNGNDGFIGSVARTSGKTGGALDFSGLPGPADVPYSPTLDLDGSPLSIAMWVWLDAAAGVSGSDQILVQRPWTAGVVEPPFTQFSVEWDLNETKTVQLLIGDPVRGTQPVISMAAPERQWVHLAFVYDGARARGFVDGKLAASSALGVPLVKRPTDLRFGGDAIGSQRFGGKLDEVRLYRGILPDQDIARLAER